MKANGKIIKCMVKEYSDDPTKENMKENIFKIRNMVEEYLNGQMVRNTMGNEEMGNSMEKVGCKFLIKSVRKAFGKTVKELNGCNHSLSLIKSLLM